MGTPFPHNFKMRRLILKPKAQKASKTYHPKDVKNLLDRSYGEKKKIPDGYKVDKKLSGKRVQVYAKEGADAIVVHRGTKGIHDVITDAKFMISKKWAHNSKRFKHSEKIQKEAEKKYSGHHVTTMGHSLGGAIAEKVGHKSDKIITLNKAASLTETKHKKPKHQTDIYSKADIVSVGARHQKGGKTIAVEEKSKNVLTEHGTKILDRVHHRI